MPTFAPDDSWTSALKLISQAKRQHAYTLNLNGLGLTQIPYELWQLKDLRVLELNANKLQTLPEEIKLLSHLTNLSLSDNNITTFPEPALHLPNLTTLYLNQNHLTSLPSRVGTMLALERLFLGANPITQLPQSFRNLTRLRIISLQTCKLNNFPESLQGMHWLHDLDVQTNKLTELPAWIGDLRELQRLLLNNNQLTQLPESIGKLSKLRILNAWNNKLTHIPQSISSLVSLEELNLWKNNLVDLPDIFENLIELKNLCLEDNRLGSLPNSMGNAKRLELLQLHGNPDLGLPDEILGNSSFPAITNRPGIKHTNPKELLDYYFEIQGGKGRALREIKLILVGRGEVGKSSMADVLQLKKFVRRRKRTDGIAISRWKVNLPDGDATMLLWDFGGQEIMHGTHQFFLTRRSLYIVMVDGRHDRGKQDAEYWLKIVRAFGGDSQILLVMNRQDDHPFDVDRQYLAGKYSVALDNFFPTDCAKPCKIAPLRNAVLKMAAETLGREEKFPVKCWDVKTRLDEMKQRGENYLSDQDYVQICTQHGVADPAEQQRLLSRLADLGTVVSFPEDGRLADFAVLNPEWVTDGIYRVVTNEQLRDQRYGLLNMATLRAILPKARWPKLQHLQYLLDLMEKFELCFSVEGQSGTVLVTELLRDETPPLDDWNANECVIFVYKYVVLPHGILPRFITRTNEKSQQQLRWRTGVVVADDDALALVRADYDANKINIWVRGASVTGRRALLKIVRHHFEAIHGRFKDLEMEELIAVPKHPEVTVSYRDLVLDEKIGVRETRVTIAGERFAMKLDYLLSGIESSAERRKSIPKYQQAGLNVVFKAGSTAVFNQENMETKNVQKIENSTIHGQVGVNQTFTNCFHMLKQVRNDDVRASLDTLIKAVEVLHPNLEDGKARVNVERKLQLLTDEASQDAPDKDQIQLSGKGLIEAAKTCGAIAGPVVIATKAIMGLFGVPIP